MPSPYWVFVDFGSDHRVCRTTEQPDSSWEGPFRTLTAVKEFLWNAAMNEIDGIRRVRDGWHRAGDRVEKAT